MLSKLIAKTNIVLSLTIASWVAMFCSTFLHILPSSQLGTWFSINIFVICILIVRKIITVYHIQINWAPQSSHLLYAFVILSNLFIFSFLQREKFVYFWDFSAYWTTTINYSNLLSNDFISSIKQIYASILYDDYTLLPSVLLSTPLKILTFGYDSYVLAIFNVYLLPFYFLFLTLVLKIKFGEERIATQHLIYILPIIFLFPPIISPALAGYVDSIGLIFIITILIILYLDPLTEINWKRNLGIALLLVLFAFTRRWYSFWIASFFISFFISGTIRLIFDKKFLKTQYLKQMCNLTIIGSSSLVILYLFFNSFIERSIFNNYSIAYSAYKNGHILENMKNAVLYFGILPMLFSLLGLISGLIKEQTRYFSLFLFTHLLITFLAFINTQSFAIHHYYLLAVTVLLFTTLGLINILSFFQNSQVKVLVGSLVVLLSFGNFMQVYSREDYQIIKEIKPMFSNFKAPPRIRNDINQLQDMKNYLNQLTANSGHHIYVLASSGILNDDILRMIDMPALTNAIPSMYVSHHVDKRDGFPNDFLEAEYVIVADPIQYHLRSEDQKVIGLLAGEILSGERLSNNYRLIRQFTLDNGVTAKVFHKVLPFDRNTVEYIRNVFNLAYPNFPILNEVSDLSGLLYERIIGEQYGVIEILKTNEVYLHPGLDSITSFSLNLNKQYSSISFNVEINPEIKTQITNSSVEGEVFFSLHGDQKILAREYVSVDSTKQLSFDIKGLSSITFSVDSGKHGPYYDQLILSQIKLK